MLKRLSSLALTALLVSVGSGMQASLADEATTETVSPVATAPVSYYTAAPYYFDPYGLGHLEFALAESAAIEDAMDREMARQLSLMDNQRRWMDSIHDWKKARSDAWRRWVDPWGAAQRDWMDARFQQVEALHNAYRSRLDRGYGRYYYRTPETVASVTGEEDTRAK
ncbi:MAG: hypothetical protein U9R74_17650 [Pseudomonadota bacterium]|nr:hypothetical protein [Pseudomonadota bacterium]